MIPVQLLRRIDGLPVTDEVDRTLVLEGGDVAGVPVGIGAAVNLALGARARDVVVDIDGRCLHPTVAWE